MWGPRWLAALTLSILVIVAGDAGAQAFKPRGGKSAPAKTEKAKAPASGKKAARKGKASRAKAKKKPARAAQPDPVRRGTDDDDDDVTIVDDDE